MKSNDASPDSSCRAMASSRWLEPAFTAFVSARPPCGFAEYFTACGPSADGVWLQ